MRYISLGMEKNLNIFEPDFISNKITWNIGKKAGITESESKSKSYQKFLIDKIEYSESEINNDSEDAVIEEIKYQLNPKLRLRRKI